MPSNPVRAAANFYGSGYRLNQQIKETGLPRWAWWIISVASVLAVGAAVATYVATRSVIAPEVFVFVGWLVVVTVAYFGNLARRTPR